MTGFGRGVQVVWMGMLIPAVLSGQARARTAVRHAPAPVVVPAPVRLAVAPAGNEARFIVHEKLMIFESANNAIGVTRAISGGITLTPAGAVDSANSQITVDLSTLTSDKENRDKWIKEHTLKTDSFPNAVFTLKQAQGLPATLPTSGTVALRLVGDLTIHGVTHPTIWSATLSANGNDFTGTATTHVKFGDFRMEQPRLMIVESVVDDITLQYNFHLVRSAGRQLRLSAAPAPVAHPLTRAPHDSA